MTEGIEKIERCATAWIAWNVMDGGVRMILTGDGDVMWEETTSEEETSGVSEEVMKDQGLEGGTISNSSEAMRGNGRGVRPGIGGTMMICVGGSHLGAGFGLAVRGLNITEDDVVRSESGNLVIAGGDRAWTHTGVKG